MNLISFFLLFFGFELLAQESVSSRHIVLLQADSGVIHGSFYLGIVNPLSAPQKIRHHLMIPKETAEFKAQDGVAQSDLTTETGGGVVIDKTFPPGMTLVSIAFQYEASGDSTTLTFEAPYLIPELAIAWPKNLPLKISHPRFAGSLPHMLDATKYHGIQSQGPIAKGERIQLQIESIPQGRRPYERVALIYGFALVGLLGFAMFRRQRRSVILND